MAGPTRTEPGTAPGDQSADELFVEVYDRLKTMARRELARSDGSPGAATKS